MLLPHKEMNIYTAGVNDSALNLKQKPSFVPGPIYAPQIIEGLYSHVYECLAYNDNAHFYNEFLER